MGRFKKLNRIEVINFLDISGSANLFPHLVKTRYKKEGLEIPEDVKSLFWFCDTVSELAKDYNTLFFKIKNDTVHKPIKTNKYNNKRPHD